VVLGPPPLCAASAVVDCENVQLMHLLQSLGPLIVCDGIFSYGHEYRDRTRIWKLVQLILAMVPNVHLGTYSTVPILEWGATGRNSGPGYS